MYYLYSITDNRFEYSFDTMQSLIAYLSHYNTYIDEVHPVIPELASEACNSYIVNYFVGIRLLNGSKQSSFNTAGLSKKTIKMLVKNCKVCIDKSGSIALNDLEILDGDYNHVDLDQYDIDAILRRLCSYTEYKSNYDIPNFKYRSMPVPNCGISRYRGGRCPRLFQERRLLHIPEYVQFSRKKRLKIERKERDNYRNKSWKEFGRARKQWELKVRNKYKHISVGNEVNIL